MDGPIAEYKKHKGTIAMYPFRNDIWRDNAMHMQEYMCRLVDIISKYEEVYYFCDNRFIDELKKRYKKTRNVFVIPAEYDDIWARDIGPTFIIRDSKRKCIDWKFNAWGGKKQGSYYPWDKDDAFASYIANHFNLETEKSSIIVEGGGIVTDGDGTLFTTRSVILNPNRNPFKKKEYVEAQISYASGASRIVWLKQGLKDDETNGHIDNVLSFINEREICIAWTEDRKNPNYRRVRDIEKLLMNIKNLKGEDYIIHHIPLPPIQYMSQEEANGLCKANSLERNAGDVLPASYMNYYMINGAVLIPSFGCETDEEALRCFKKLFVDREVIQIYSREPLLGGGGIHCLLHEVPILE